MPNKPPRAYSPRKLKLLLNLYPPFLLGRIRVVELAADFRRCTVRLTPSLLTRNLQGTIFGGTIYSAADPHHAMLFWQIFAHRGTRIQAWIKSARVEFHRPAASKLTMDFELSDADVAQATAALEGPGRFCKTFRTAAIDRDGQVCARIETEVYLRVPEAKQPAGVRF